MSQCDDARWANLRLCGANDHESTRRSRGVDADTFELGGADAGARE